MEMRLIYAFLLMGFTSLVVQTMLIREFLITFYGNELTIGLILANWIILEAIGAGLASRPAIKTHKSEAVYAMTQVGIALYLPISIYFARTMKNLLGLSLGEGVGILSIVFSSFLVLAPLSLLDGAQFPFGCRMMSDSSRRPLESSGRVYVLEAIGFILAGPIFTYILITKLNSFCIALLLGALNLSSALFLLKNKLYDISIKAFFTITSLFLVLILLAFFGPASSIHSHSINEMWRGQKVLTYKNSVYGNLAATEAGGQYTFYSDGIPMISAPSPDIEFIEEFAHFAMLSNPDAKDVLLLGGGAGGMINEILKYKIKKLTYVELDPLLIKILKEFPTGVIEGEFGDPRLDIVNVDVRRFIRLTKNSYDVIMMNLPMPSTLQLNRFYTKEFFENIKSVLSANGIFAFSLPGSLSYISPDLKKLNGCILNTVEDLFRVNIIPGDRNFYIAAKRYLATEPAVLLERLREKGIQTKVLNRRHIEYRLDAQWMDWFKASLSNYKKIRKNFDLLPSGTLYAISYWNALFSKNMHGLFRALDKLSFALLSIAVLIVGGGILIAATFIERLRKGAVGASIYTTGFMGMSFELIVIYAYQSIFGFVFHHLALLAASFMAGLTLGGWLMTRRLAKIKNDFRYFSVIELSAVGFCLAAGPTLLCLNHYASSRFAVIFFVLSGISGYIVGLEFPLANKMWGRDKNYAETGGLLYALDLGGAWFAALATSVILVPVIGIVKTCILLAILKAMSLIYLIIGKP